MDAAVLGSVIGIVMLACLGLSVVVQDKGAECWAKTKRRFQRWRQQRQPLLPTEVRNPMVVRRSHWKVNQLLDLK